MRFIPMNFCLANSAIFKANCSNSFQFSLPPRTIYFSQKFYLSNRVADRDGFYIGDVADNFKVPI